MVDWLWLGLGSSSIACAAFAIVLGRNLTRSVTAGYVFLASLGIVLAMAGAGTLAWLVAISATVVLATLQVFGWMLVDVDRDHLPPSDRVTRVARGLAFLLLAGGLAWLGYWAASELATAPPRLLAVEIDDLGLALFEGLPAEALLLGLAIAAALLATLLLLRDPGGER